MTINLNFLPVKSVVLFGAGASFGTHHVLPQSPPLGGDLYHALREFDPAT